MYQQRQQAAIIKKHDIALGDSAAESDPAYPIVAAILRVVPVSRWAFARPDANGQLAHLLNSPGEGGELALLAGEYSRQREKSNPGPRIAAMLGALGDYEIGVTMLFADERANCGILMLLRTRDCGPFTSSEIAILTLALHASSEPLSALRRNPSVLARSTVDQCADARTSTKNVSGEDYVLDRDLQIVMTWNAEKQHRAAITGLRTCRAERLPIVLEDAVRDLVAGWQDDPITQLPGVARPVPFLVVRTQPVAGPTGLLIGVRIDRFQPQRSLAAPAARFHISSRELEVLSLLIEGSKVEEIGRTLGITASTVQGHLKNMIDKTESRNRTALVARILGWESSSKL